MPVDASIYGAFAPAAKSVQDYQDQDLMRQARLQGIEQNKLAMLGQRQKLDEYQRGVQEQGLIRNALSGLGANATDEQRIAALKGTGLASAYTQADALQKAGLERTKTEAEARAKQSEALSKLLSAQGDLAGRVMANPTPQAASAALANMKLLSRQLGIQLDFSGDDAAIQQFQTPEQIRQWAAGHALNAKELLPKLQVVNGGDAQINQSVNPLTGAVTETGRTAIAQSPDSVASNATQRRGQDMTDARAREANATQKLLVNQERQLKVDELQDKADQRARQKQAAIASFETQLGVIDKAINHPGRETSTGLSGSIDPRNYVPGTDATDFRAVLDQIGGSAFLQAFESLKGGGAITEVEGKKATDAIARLNRAQSDGEFAVALQDLRKVMTDGYKRLSGKDYGGSSGAAPAGKPVQIKDDAGYNALPSGALFVGPDGKTRRKP